MYRRRIPGRRRAHLRVTVTTAVVEAGRVVAVAAMMTIARGRGHDLDREISQGIEVATAIVRARAATAADQWLRKLRRR